MKPVVITEFSRSPFTHGYKGGLAHTRPDAVTDGCLRAAMKDREGRT